MTTLNVVTSSRKLSELALVDDLVIAIGEVIAIEAFRHIDVTNDFRSCVSIGFSVIQECAASADVISVTMGVHQAIE